MGTFPETNSVDAPVTTETSTRSVPVTVQCRFAQYLPLPAGKYRLFANRFFMNSGPDASPAERRIAPYGL